MNSSISIFVFIVICLGVALLFKLILIKATNSYKKENYSIQQVGDYYIITVKDNGKVIPADQFLKAYRKEINPSLYNLLEENYTSYKLAEIALMRFRVAIGQTTL